jgi:tRNA nucleotidyltransferase/poly(A) polymerase
MNFTVPTYLPRAKNAYLVGGTVRDLIMERRPVDCDLAVAGDPDDFARSLLKSIPGRQVVIGRGDQTVLRVVTAQSVFDICALSGAGIEEDLARRDFTINAMAVCLSSGRLIDPFNGRADIAAGRVRSVADSVFADDPARLLRAYRVAAQLGFGIEANTSEAIARHAFRIEGTAGERLREELFKLLAVTDAAEYLAQMAVSGLLGRLFPELEALVGCRQPSPHQWDAFDHSLETVRRLEELLDDWPSPLSAYRRSIDALNDPDAAARLKCTALLHDIGKPHCRSTGRDGRIHFHGHPAHSGRLAVGISRRLHFSKRESDYLQTIIGHHQRPMHLYSEWRRRRFSARAIARLFRACGNLTPDLLLHAMADMAAKTSAPPSGSAFRQFACELMARFFDSFLPVRSQPPLLTGHDLIQRFGLRPSPLFKEILDELDIARHAGTVTNRTEAEAVVERMLVERRTPSIKRQASDIE